MRRSAKTQLGVLAVLLPHLTACGVSGPLPEYRESVSVIDYTDELVTSTTSRNLDRLFDTTRDGQTADYRWYTGWWCPRHDQVNDAVSAAGEFEKLCRSKGGQYDGVQFCRDGGDADVVIFVARVTATRECSNGPTATIQVYEPTSGMNGPAYVAKLYELGYQSAADRERAALQREKARQEREIAEQRRAELHQLELAANKVAILEASEGTRICRSGPIDYVLEPGIRQAKRSDGVLIAQLEKLSKDHTRVQFRVVGHSIPGLKDYELQYSHSYRMGEFLVQPGIVYWDVVEHWRVCDLG